VGWLLNGVLLKDIYVQTPNLWRSQDEMMSLFHWIIIGQALIVFAFVMIYASGFAAGGVIAGIPLGRPAGNRGDRHAHGFYAVQPIPGNLLFYGSLSGAIEMIIVGAIVGGIYKRQLHGRLSDDLTIGRWTFGVERWTFVLCYRKLQPHLAIGCLRNGSRTPRPGCRGRGAKESVSLNLSIVFCQHCAQCRGADRIGAGLHHVSYGRAVMAEAHAKFAWALAITF